MLRSHRIPCSRIPAPLFVFLRRATPSHFHLHERLSHGYSISAAQYMPARCFPHARSHFRMPAHSHTRSHFRRVMHARLHFRCALAVPHTTAHCARPLAVSRMPPPARISAARSQFPARLLTAHARSLFPARPRPLAFPLRARCSPHNRSLRTPTRCFPHAHARSFPRARSLPRASSVFGHETDTKPKYHKYRLKQDPERKEWPISRFR
jgi:hypothetical protein